MMSRGVMRPWDSHAFGLRQHNTLQDSARRMPVFPSHGTEHSSSVRSRQLRNLPSARRDFATSLCTASTAGLLLSLVLPTRTAFAYIDPGTSQAIWSTLAPILGILVACLAVLLLPARFAWRRLRSLWQKRSPRVRGVLVLGAAAFVALSVLCAKWAILDKDKGDAMSEVKAKPSSWKRVIVLGIDGLDPDRLEQMMDAGELPNFARLRREGTFARLQTSVPPETPVAWLCAATGVNPGKHGVFDFIGRDPKRYLPDLTVFRTNPKGAFALRSERYVPASSRPAFWDILSEKGTKVSVIRWPVTFPPRPVNGRLLSGLGTPDVAGTLGCYHFFTTAPLLPDDKAADRVTITSWRGNATSTDLPGPRILTLRGTKVSTIPMTIEQSNDGGSVAIQLGEARTFSLRPGEWSEWVAVNFPGGFSRSCPAAVRMYLSSVSPELALYVTPPQINPRNPAFPISHPGEFAPDLAENIGSYYTLGIPEDTQAVRHGRIPLTAFLEQCDQITEERERMLDEELGRFKRGLLAIVFDTSDRIQHMFYGMADATHPAYSPSLEAQFGEVIAAHYRRMDGVLGKVLKASEKNTAVFVMSDHGFTSFKRAVHLNRWLIENGFMTLQGTDDAEGLPLFKKVDWSRTRAYAVGFCSLYLNVRGREGHGTVAEGEAYRQVREELSRKLKVWTDPENGDQVVRNVYARDEIYQGQHLDRAPDLIVGYCPGYRGSWQTAVGAAPAGDAVVDNDELWSGDHLVDAPCVPGVFLSNIQCRDRNPRLIDIAPTVLRSLDIEGPADLDGRCLF